MEKPLGFTHLQTAEDSSEPSVMIEANKKNEVMSKKQKKPV